MVTNVRCARKTATAHSLTQNKISECLRSTRLLTQHTEHAWPLLHECRSRGQWVRL